MYLNIRDGCEEILFYFDEHLMTLHPEGKTP